MFELDSKYEIDGILVKKYVKSIDALTISTKKIKENLSFIKTAIVDINKIDDDYYKNIIAMSEQINLLTQEYPDEQGKIYLNSIRQIVNQNNGMISTRMVDLLDIDRQYLSIMKKNNELESLSRGIYARPDVFQDSYYMFQMKYKKVIFSHMNALYFSNLTEEFPYEYTVTVPQRYHVNSLNEKCNVFYVSDNIIDLGLCEVQTPDGHIVRAYDLERSICDIIRSKNRMDFEQVKKSVRLYMHCKDKDLKKLSLYSKKMGIDQQVMEMVGMYYD